MTFDDALFRVRAGQFRDLGWRYHTEHGLDAETAARWANHGFMPSEVGPWLGFTPERAAFWDDKNIDPAEARRKDSK